MTTSTHRELSWLVLLPALIVPAIGALFYFVLFPEGSVGQAAYTITKLFTLFYPLLFLRRTGLGGLLRRRRGKGSWPGWGAVIWTGMLCGAAISSLGMLLMLTPLGEIVKEGSGAVTERAEGLGFARHFLLFAVFLSLIHSALEEFYWRWFVYGQLQRRVSRWMAHAVAALAFGGHHLIITLQFFSVSLALFLTTCVVAGGFIWSIMYERQGTVIGCWVSHICVDVMLMIIGFQLIKGA